MGSFKARNVWNLISDILKFYLILIIVKYLAVHGKTECFHMIHFIVKLQEPRPGDILEEGSFH